MREFARTEPPSEREVARAFASDGRSLRKCKICVNNDVFAFSLTRLRGSSLPEGAFICAHLEHNPTPNLCEDFVLFSEQGGGKSADRRQRESFE